MAYQKIGFKNGNVLTAEQLIHMEDGIINAEKKAGAGTPGAGTPGDGGTGLPSDVGAYKYMATDGNGDWLAADRLGYKKSGNKDFVSNVTVSKENEQISGGGFVAGKEYTVVWDGVSYTCIAKEYGDFVMIGNNAIYEDDDDDTTDTGEPFAIESKPGENRSFVYFASDDTEEHIVSISGYGESIHPIPAEYLTKGRISFTSDGTNYACNVPFAELADAVTKALPAVYAERSMAGWMMSNLVSFWFDFTQTKATIEINVNSIRTLVLEYDADSLRKVSDTIDPGEST